AWSFAVDSVYKGEIHEEQEIVTSQQSSACGFSFDEGQRYVVFAFSRPGGTLTTNSCSNTRPWPAGRELALGGAEPHPPVRGQSGRSNLGVLIVGGLLIGGAALTFTKLRRVSTLADPTTEDQRRD
ncbi:MAG TPA: hypothetical protein VFK89_12825, partial [Actinomycetota bacterium]|nr:hypothetical protein [Actinomycetota bacterium]